MAARAADGTLAVVYTQSLGSFDLDTSGFAGAIEATRIDPTDAGEQALAGSPYPNGASQTIVLDTQNAGGDDDWLLRFRVLP